MRKKLKKKIDYEKKIINYLKRKKKFLTWQRRSWLILINPALNMQSPQQWINCGWGNRLWNKIQNEENIIRSLTTNK